MTPLFTPTNRNVWLKTFQLLLCMLVVGVHNIVDKQLGENWLTNTRRGEETSHNVNCQCQEIL